MQISRKPSNKNMAKLPSGPQPGHDCCGGGADVALRSHHKGSYDEAEKSSLPEKAVAASLAAAIPQRSRNCSRAKSFSILARRRHSMCSSRKTGGPHRQSLRLDMTDEMLALAAKNQKKAGVENVEFLKARLRHPASDNSVDVIISNCVINLSGDKDRVLSESFPRPQPGGRLAVS